MIFLPLPHARYGYLEKEGSIKARPSTKGVGEFGFPVLVQDDNFSNSHWPNEQLFIGPTPSEEIQSLWV
jgi:hypothetical protein